MYACMYEAQPSILGQNIYIYIYIYACMYIYIYTHTYIQNYPRTLAAFAAFADTAFKLMTLEITSRGGMNLGSYVLFHAATSLSGRVFSSRP
jgi:hypothetical protein